MEFKWNSDQDNAIIGITNFVNSPFTDDDSYFITLSGFAGTGKTTVMKAIIDKIQYKKKVVVSAPTHKAKQVIAEKTKQNAETIQALLGLRPDVSLDDFNPNKPVFNNIAEERIGKYNVVVIDEASMINTASLKLIKEKAKENKVKVIFMGDKYQLPPIGEKISKVFLLKNVVELNIIERQKGNNPNLHLIELARNDVRDGTDTAIKYLYDIVSDVNTLEEGFTLLNQVTYYNDLLTHYFDSEYKQNPELVKTICYTNEAVRQTNQFLRSKIVNSDELVAVGDIMMGYKSVSEEIKVFPFFLTNVVNGQDYIVEDVNIEERTIIDSNYWFYNVKFKDQDRKVNILHRKSYDAFSIELENRLNYAKQRRSWKQYYNFKNQVVLLEPITNQYGIKLVDKDIDYGYAVTVHKSQGSTYENVGITLKDLFRNRTPQELRSLIYVALSRTSKRNLIYAK